MSTKISWAYVAGFFDGEGHVCVITKNSNVGLCQAGPEGERVLHEIAAMCATVGIHCGVYDSNELKRETMGLKRMYRLSIQGRESCRRFLIRVLPYLRVKRVIAQDALRFFTLYPPIYGGTEHRKVVIRPGYFARTIYEETAFIPRKKAYIRKDRQVAA